MLGGDVYADFHALPFKARSFDLIRATECLYHTCHIGSVLHEFGRVLKTTGRMVFTVPLLFAPINSHDKARLTEAGWRSILPYPDVKIVRLGGYFSLLVTLLEALSPVCRVLRPLARFDDAVFPHVALAYGIVVDR